MLIFYQFTSNIIYVWLDFFLRHPCEPVDLLWFVYKLCRVITLGEYKTVGSRHYEYQAMLSL